MNEEPPCPPVTQDAAPEAAPEATYQIRTMAEAKALAAELAGAHPDPDRVVIGLTELLVNAVEHGNLGITYEEKAELLERGDLQAEIERRLALPELAERRVTVTLRRDPECLSASIEDEGEGFDWRPYLEYDPERVLDASGHGIAIACGVCFDEVTYHGRGNRVVATVRLGSPPEPGDDAELSPPSRPG
jgi:sigma-B regulation protein RsbU (phosphoserine phosphatase)